MPPRVIVLLVFATPVPPYCPAITVLFQVLPVKVSVVSRPIRVVVALGRVMVLSAVGSVMVSVVSNPSPGEPSKMILTGV